MCNSAAHNNRPNRESVRKRIGERTYREICERDGHACVYCGATAEQSGTHLQLDHLVPRADGGEDRADNLVLACRTCNSMRQNLSLSQWAAYAATTRGLTINARRIRAQARRLAA